MANKAIKGITIEIDGSTKGLDNALKDVNSESISLQNELKQVERLLKFDPGNTELIAQKQQLLTQQVQTTTEKLNRLKDAQSQVEKQFQSGDIGSEQYRAFQREVIQTESKLNGLEQQLKQVGDTSIQPVKQDLSQVSKEAENAEGSVKDLGGELTNLLAGAAAGKGISEVIEDALDTSSLNTKIDISFNVPPESMGTIKEAINTVSSYGVDAEEALEGVRRQWALNKDASDESNQAVVNGAATITAAYSGIDFNELIQETNEISSALNISNEDALALTNSLMKMGFPPEQIDIIAEYGTQLSEAGYNAEEVQAIMAAGVDTGTWNIDNLLDGLKEGRIKLAEFGQEVPKATQELIASTDISTQQLQSWGQAVAKGGEGGKQAMQEVAQALTKVDDETTRNALGTQLFGTIWEDQGTNITDTLLNMDNHLISATENQNALNESTEKLNSDPAIQMEQAMSNLKVALQPLLEVIASVIGKIAEWISNNPTLAATIVAVVTVLGILMGIIMGLAPVFTAMTLATGALNIAMLPLIGIILGIMASIAALIAIGVALYKNWDEIKAKAIEIWGAIKEWFSSFWESTKEVFNIAIETISTFINEQWNNIKTTTLIIWNGIKEFFISIWEGIKNVFNTVITAVVEFVKSKWDNLKTNTASIFDAIKNVVSTIWNGIKSFFTNIVSNIFSTVSSKFDNLKSAISNIMNSIKSVISNIWDNVMSFFQGINLFDIGKNIIEGLINGIKNMISKVSQVVSDIANTIKDKIKSALDIHSPSRVMMEMGEYTGEGFVEGIKSTIGAISKQSQAMANAVNPTVSIDGISNLGNNYSIGDTVIHAQVETILDGKAITKAITPMVITNISRGQANREMGKGRF